MSKVVKIRIPDVKPYALKFSKTLFLLEFILKNDTLNISRLDFCLELFSSIGGII